MPYLREYIRNLLKEDQEETQAFGECPMQYDPEKILKESKELSNDFDLVNENMNLAYFHRNMSGNVDGVAWVENCGKFNFAIVTNESASNSVFSALVSDCMNEFYTLKNQNNDLVLEVKVEDEETEVHLIENYGLSVLRQYPGIVILGNK
jgi:hypothetical protein